MVFSNEISLDKGCGSVKYVVIGSWVEVVSYKAVILALNLVFNNEGYIIKRQGQVLFKDQPVVVGSINSVTFVHTQY